MIARGKVKIDGREIENAKSVTPVMSAEEFKATQRRLGKKNHELAAEIGRSLSSVTKYRRGEVEVPPTVAKLMRLLEVNYE